MVSRLDNRDIGLNKTSVYHELLESRGVNQINQYFTPKMRHPTSEEISHLQLIPYEWKLGDRYYKVAEKYYNDPKLWWVIAFFNQLPTEAHVQMGQTIQVPLPLDKILSLLGY